MVFKDNLENYQNAKKQSSDEKQKTKVLKRVGTDKEKCIVNYPKK
jgi:hypothetical protein